MTGGQIGELKRTIILEIKDRRDGKRSTGAQKPIK